MNATPSRTSWRPSGPLPTSVGVYPAREPISHRAIGAIATFLFLLALALSIYMWLTGGQ